VGLLTTERAQLVLARAAGENVAIGEVSHRDVGDDRAAVRRRHRNRERVRAGELRPALRMTETTWRGRRQRRDETAVSEAPHPVAEHTGRKCRAAHDEPGMLGRVRELGLAHRMQDEVAERALSVPALVSRLGDDLPRLRVRPELVPGLEPLDPADTVPLAAGGLGREEVRSEHLDVGGAEPKRFESKLRLVRRQAAASS
jgi:hypothetical protein